MPLDYLLADAPLTLTDKIVAAMVVSVCGVLMIAVLARVPLIYNIRNLLVRWPITVLTVSAFVMVVGLLTVMLAFVNGMYRLTENSGNKENIIILGQGTQDEVFSSLGFTDADDIENVAGILRDEQGRPVVSKETYVIVNQPTGDPKPGQPVVLKPGQPKRRFLQVRGIEVPDLSGLVHRVDLEGEWFSTAGVRPDPANANNPNLVEAVIGQGIARTLGVDQDKPSLQIGDQFVLGDRRCVIVGLMLSRGKTFDSEIWAKRELVGKTYGKETYTTMVLRATDAKEAVRLEQYLTNDYGKGSLQPMLETKYFANLNGTNQQFLYAIIVVAIVMAVGGVFGVTNTMFAAIAQRTKDIGVMRLIGFGRLQILGSFLLESLLIALVGGGIGCLIGSVSDGWTANSIMGSGQGGGKSVVLELTVDWMIIAECLLFSLAMGLIGGLLPAISAMRMKLLDTLR